MHFRRKKHNFKIFKKYTWNVLPTKFGPSDLVDKINIFVNNVRSFFKKKKNKKIKINMSIERVPTMIWYTARRRQ